METKESIVLYPGFGVGHITPAIELAKLFVADGFAATVVAIDTTLDLSSSLNAFVANAAANNPSISFHILPKVTPSPAIANDIPLLLTHIPTIACPHLLDFLRPKQNVRALVVNLFCSSAIDVARVLNIPSYYFYSSSAATLAAFSFFPSLESEFNGSPRELGDTPLNFPGLPPVPASDLIVDLLDPGERKDALLSHFIRMPKADGIMINTFEYLESRAVKALADGLCSKMPPLYCIGPLISGDDNKKTERHECLVWLDAQPEKSVVFLCFGSMGKFEAEQMKEIANGLERSGQRFLWVVRSPGIPKGFVEQTQGRGLVVTTWAPQAAVLGHKSVGVFVSHCGWNSTLEAVSSGVPMIGWPLYAEQRVNKIMLVEEAKIAVGIEGYKKGVVSAEEVERKIKYVMESEEGRVMRERASEMKEKAAAARKEDGSSSLAWMKLVTALRKDSPSGKTAVSKD